MATRTFVAVAMLLAVAGAASARQLLQQVASAQPMVNGFVMVAGHDIPGKDLSCGPQGYCKSCSPSVGPNTAGGGFTKEFWYLQDVCRKTRGCVGWTYEDKAPGCAYLKSAAGPGQIQPRAGWTVISTQIVPPAPNMCKGGCGGKK